MTGVSQKPLVPFERALMVLYWRAVGGSRKVLGFYCGRASCTINFGVAHFTGSGP